MSTEQDLVHGRVSELGAFDGGDRLKATLVPEDDGPPVRVDLKTPPPELAAAVVMGARIGCRAYLRTGQRGMVRVAFWIDYVERREGPDRWERVWTAPKPFVARRRQPPAPAPLPVAEERLEGGSVRRRRPLNAPPERPPRGPATTTPPAPAAVAPEDGSIVSGTLRRLERLPNMRTLGTVLPVDGGPVVEVRLRRAPRGLFAALASGARVHCVAAPHVSGPGLRFSARVVSVDLKDGEGQYREAWRHDPSREHEHERDGGERQDGEDESGHPATIVSSPAAPSPGDNRSG